MHTFILHLRFTIVYKYYNYCIYLIFYGFFSAINANKTNHRLSVHCVFANTESINRIIFSCAMKHKIFIYIFVVFIKKRLSG